MLPHSDHGPARLAQLGVVQSIALHISGDLGAPVGGVGLRARSVVWAAMPEAAIDENSHLLTPKDDVCSAAQALQRLLVDAIAKAASMKLRPEGKLRPGVALAIALHGGSDGWRGGRGGFGNDGGRSLGAHSIGGSF